MPQLPSLVALIASTLATATHAAEIVNCWGGNSSIGSAQTECTIIKMTKNRKVFTITDQCTDIRGGGQIAGGPTVLTIDSPTRFTRDNEACRHCGTDRQFQATPHFDPGDQDKPEMTQQQTTEHVKAGRDNRALVVPAALAHLQALAWETAQAFHARESRGGLRALELA